MTFACRVLGHRWQFWRERATVRWRCARGCGAGGARGYPSAAEAARHLRHYAREPRPPVGLLTALAGAVPRRPPRGRGGDGRVTRSGDAP